MDKLLKLALDGNVVDFVAEFKSKMSDVYADQKQAITRKVAAAMAGTEVVQEETVIKGGKKFKMKKNQCQNCEVLVDLKKVKNNKCPNCGRDFRWKSTAESVMTESIKSDLDSLKADEMKRKGKLVTLYWDGEGKVSKADVEKAVKANMDKIKFVGVSNKDGKTVAEIEMK